MNRAAQALAPAGPRVPRACGDEPVMDAAWRGAELWHYTDKGHRLTAAAVQDRLAAWVLGVG